MSLIPGAQIVHPREVWQDPKYPVFGPPAVQSLWDTVVIHYTAADDLIDGDPGEHAEDLPAYIRAMQKSYVLNRGYSVGYMFAVDWLGGIWQLRGWDFKSAANAGHNDHTVPILVLVDGNDMATDEAAASIRLIVAEAQRRGGKRFPIVGHGQLSGAATACPGIGLRTQITAGVFHPYTGATPAPPVQEDDDDMPKIAYYVKPPTGYPQGSPELVVVDADVRYRTNADRNGILPDEVLPPEQYEKLLRAVKL